MCRMIHFSALHKGTWGGESKWKLTFNYVTQGKPQALAGVYRLQQVLFPDIHKSALSVAAIPLLSIAIFSSMGQ